MNQTSGTQGADPGRKIAGAAWTRVRTLLRQARRSAWTVFGAYVVFMPAVVGGVALAVTPFDELLQSVIEEPATALDGVGRALLTTGVSLLTVALSVMFLVLNLTSQQISPRALTEQLRRPMFRHAVGFLFGCFSTGAAVVSSSYNALFPSASPTALVLLCMLLMFGAVWAFVGTIQHWATNLQINKILARLYDDGRRDIEAYFAMLERLEGAQEAEGFDEEGEPLLTSRSGYVELIDWDSLVEIACGADARIVVTAEEGEFNGMEIPALYVICGRELSKDEWNDIRACVQLGSDRAPDQHPYRTLSVISDIALKGLSPAYNDPTTALSAIDYLTDLLCVILERPDVRRYLLDSEGTPRVRRKIVKPKLALDQAYRQTAHYAAGNDGVTAYLLDSVRRLALAPISDEGKQAALWFLKDRIGVEGPVTRVEFADEAASKAS